MIRKYIILLIIVAFAAGISLYIFKLLGAGALDVVHPIRGPAVEAVYATGTVEPTVMIPIAPRQTGRLVALLADEGLKVKQNQPLAQLEDIDLAQMLIENQSRADLAQKQYNRVAGLEKRQAISVQSVDQAKAELDAANAAVAQTQAQLTYLKLLAPEDGYVIKRDGEVGQTIPANQEVFWMSCCAPFRISAEVDEEDIALVQPGQNVTISADAFPGKIFKGAVTSVTPKGDPIARSYRVRIALDGDTPLMIGMTAEANIIAHENKDALLVPASAVINGKLWVAENGALKSIAVETGAKTTKAVEIIKGLDENALVIMDAGQTLSESKPVQTSLKTWQSH